MRRKIEEIFARCLLALWATAVHNPRSTAAGVVGALVVVGARWGLSLSPDRQTELAAAVVFFIGLAAGDSHRRRRARKGATGAA